MLILGPLGRRDSCTRQAEEIFGKYSKRTGVLLNDLPCFITTFLLFLVAAGMSKESADAPTEPTKAAEEVTFADVGVPLELCQVPNSLSYDLSPRGLVLCSLLEGPLIEADVYARRPSLPVLALVHRFFFSAPLFFDSKIFFMIFN